MLDFNKKVLLEKLILPGAKELDDNYFVAKTKGKNSFRE